MRGRVLFVDDEPAILMSLRNLLHRERRRWDMVFVGSGASALDEMRKEPFDVVVSDMRMPQMDGATLLTQIQDESPATVRIVLSGHADREAIVRALPALHQLLSKPCDTNTLRGAIERAMELDARSHDRVIREVIGRIDKLPSPPAIFDELAGVLTSARPSVDEVTRIVESDPATCAKILQLVNSAYFGRGHSTASIPRAVAELGTEQLRYVALTASVFSSTPAVALPGFSIETIQHSSAKVAQIARSLVSGYRGDEAFAAGLLHDVGQIVLAIGMPDAYTDVMRRVHDGEEIETVEREVFGASHADVGAGLLQIWGLPSAIVDPVRFHHSPENAPDSTRDIAVAINFADQQVAALAASRRTS
jgi:HD-like signal output (HDOD) protein